MGKKMNKAFLGENKTQEMIVKVESQSEFAVGEWWDGTETWSYTWVEFSEKTISLKYKTENDGEKCRIMLPFVETPLKKGNEIRVIVTRQMNNVTGYYWLTGYKFLGIL